MPFQANGSMLRTDVDSRLSGEPPALPERQPKLHIPVLRRPGPPVPVPVRARCDDAALTNPCSEETKALPGNWLDAVDLATWLRNAAAPRRKPPRT